ncbi:MAG: DUF2333 family protein [Desulfobacteraceae bacterium]|nr:DUF2333 family protein [Desulfobacteraceae bacterium]
MDENKRNDNGNDETKEFKGYALKRIAVGIVLAAVALWGFGAVLGIFGSSPKTKVPATVSHAPATETFGHSEDADTTAATHDEEHAQIAEGHSPAAGHEAKTAAEAHTVESGHEKAPAAEAHTADTGHAAKPAAVDHGKKQETAEHGGDTGHAAATTPSHGEAKPHGTAETHAEAEKAGRDAEAGHEAKAGHGEAAGGHGETDHGTYFDPDMPAGVAFMEATMRPLHYELNDRWWGWRPNDLINLTDNVNEFQLGVLEVTRRTVVVLAERISRTGSTAAFDKNLENAMNWFMIKSDRYWFPSAESKYKDGLDELRAYQERLVRGEAKFHTRTDNLIPLLMAFEDLMGSCDENLVKHSEEDGSHVSFFSADDYFYYTKGVASAMHSILEAVQHDFSSIVESRRGTEVLHHAIESCREAMEIDPIIVLDSSWGSLLANHRANLAAPISHARFYLGVLIKTLST